MKLIACLQLLSVVGSIDASGIADDNNGHGRNAIEHYSIGDGAPEEPQPQPTPAQLCAGKSSANVLFLRRLRDTP